MNEQARILVVDDSSTIRRSAESMLKAEGYDVVTAENGFEALLWGRNITDDEYLQSAMDDFASDAIVPSLMHGAAAAPSWQQDVIDAVGLFIGARDVAAFQDALVAAAQ